jgi:hypothetical protein
VTGEELEGRVVAALDEQQHPAPKKCLSLVRRCRLTL